MTETGPVTYGCPARPGVLHVIESAYYAEVVDPATLTPVPSGGTGELVLTNLGRLGSPVLRYRTGDFVRPSAGPCACGTADMALEGGILGRTDDMIVVRGVNVYPGAIEEVLRACGGVAEYRVRVSQRLSLVELGLELEPAPGVGAQALAHRVENALRDAFSLRVPVTVVPEGTLPRFEMKARRWVRE
jgi:phenylacetate-CoA ligase